MCVRGCLVCVGRFEYGSGRCGRAKSYVVIDEMI